MPGYLAVQPRVQRMTNPGHAQLLPNPGGYVKVWKWLKVAVVEQPYARGWLGGRWGTAAEHLADFDVALTRRINARGQLDTGDDKVFWDFIRDRRMLEDFRLRRVVWRGSGFNTQECRVRFPDVQARMTDHSDW